VEDCQKGVTPVDIRTLAGPPTTFLGHRYLLNEDTPENLLAVAREFGDLVPLHFGNRRIQRLHRLAALVTHPDDIARIFADKTITKPYSLSISKGQFGFGTQAVGLESDAARETDQTRSALDYHHLPGYFETMLSRTESLLSTWKNGDTYEMGRELMRLALEIVGETLFSSDLTDDADTVNEALIVVMETFNKRRNYLFLVPEEFPTITNWRLRFARKRLRNIVVRILRERKASGSTKRDLVGLLLMAARQNGQSLEQTCDQAMTYFLAGHETTALTLCWALIFLAQHPEIEADLHTEIETLLGEGPLTHAALRQFKFAESIISETLRLRPPIWAMARITTQEVELRGYTIPPKTLLLLSQFVTQRDPHWFVDPETFNPYRWNKEFRKQLPRFAYFPFGGGERGCIGRNFAMMEALTLLVIIARKYKLQLVPGENVGRIASLTLRPKKLLMTVNKRSVVASLGT